MSRQKRQHFSQSFKEQIVQLRASGKPRQEILKEYGMSPSVLDKWVRQSKQGESFSERENRTTEQEELLQLRQENQQLKMENDILKQAALIMGQKSK